MRKTRGNGTMNNKNHAYRYPEPRLSAVCDKVLKPNGNGFAGFTVLYSDSDFENYILFFTQKTHEAVVAVVNARHQQWLGTLQMRHPEKNMPVISKR